MGRIERELIVFPVFCKLSSYSEHRRLASVVFFCKGFSRKNLCLMFDLYSHYFLTEKVTGSYGNGKKKRWQWRRSTIYPTRHLSLLCVGWSGDHFDRKAKSCIVGYMVKLDDMVYKKIYLWIIWWGSGPSNSRTSNWIYTSPSESCVWYSRPPDYHVMSTTIGCLSND